MATFKGRVDTHPVTLFARILWAGIAENELIEIRGICSDRSNRKVVQRWVRTPEDLYKACISLASENDLYAGVALRDGEHGDAKHVVSCNVIWADLDFKDGHTEQSRMAQIDSWPIRPSMVINSGGGLQVYIKVRRYQRDEMALARAIMKLIEDRYQGDRVGDMARIMRLPGTGNFKYTPRRDVVIVGTPDPEPVGTLEEVAREFGLSVAEPSAQKLTTDLLPVQPSTASVGPLNGNGQGPQRPPTRIEVIEGALPNMPLIPQGGGWIRGEGWEEHFTGRNSTIFEYARFKRNAGYSELDVLRLARGVAKARFQDVDEAFMDEVARTVHSCFEHDPRDMPTALTPQVTINGAVPAAAATIEPVGADETGKLPTYMWLSQYGAPRPQEWLWHPFLPKGRFMLIEGEEGIGKGLMLSHIAAKYAAEHGVLWIAAEDDYQDDIQPRVKAAAEVLGVSYPGDRIACMNLLPRFMAEDDTAFVMLAEFMARNDLSILMMDPGRSLIGSNQPGASLNDEAWIRPVLERLQRMARFYQWLALAVHHWNKSHGSPVKYRGTGSGAWRQVARHSISLAKDDQTGEGVFAVTKSNFSPLGSVTSYRIDTVDGSPEGIPVLHVGGLLPETPTLEAWMHRQRKVITGLPDHAVAQVCADAAPDHKIKIGDMLPTTGDLDKLLTQSLRKAGLKLLRAAGGVAEGPGRRLHWEKTPEDLFGADWYQSTNQSDDDDVGGDE